jgi:xanthine dehydrogenase YagS FAD-binding subunit
MIDFRFERAADAASAIRLLGATDGAKYLGGGTNVVDLMRERIEQPTTLVDVTRLSHEIDDRPDGSIFVGAAATNTAVAANLAVRTRFPVLARAILAGASGQIRNMATVGGNILQRTRCLYFYDEAARCNKRLPGAGCDGIDGFNRINAILGASPECVATHPSDMCVALAMLGAIIHLDGPSGKRSIDFTDLHRLPGDRPDLETNLRVGELIVAIELPPLPFAANSTYRKVRDRASYAFALVSVAAALDLASDGTVRDLRIALGGVAAKPWRATTAEAALRGGPATESRFTAAAAAELRSAAGLRDNTFKIELAQRTMVAVCTELVTGDPA